jgi:superfamily I DNA and/or RNA helicase
MLDIQYRMHPSISRFPSSEFYNFALRDGTVDSEGNILSSLMPPTSSHLQVDAVTGNRPSVVFLDHAGSETMKDRSRVNHNEANIVCSIVEDLLLQNEVRWRYIAFGSIYIYSHLTEPSRRRYRHHRSLRGPNIAPRPLVQHKCGISHPF